MEAELRGAASFKQIKMALSSFHNYVSECRRRLNPENGQIRCEAPENGKYGIGIEKKHPWGCYLITERSLTLTLQRLDTRS